MNGLQPTVPRHITPLRDTKPPKMDFGTARLTTRKKKKKSDNQKKKRSNYDQ